jgi:phosphatidylglycerophosphatase A
VTPARLPDRVGLLVATCGYLGFAPVAPGTFGSAAGLALYGMLRFLGWEHLELLLIAAIFVVGVWSSTAAERQLGGIDPGPVVIDEVLGMLVTLALIPVNLPGAIIGFLLFRLLDVVKPWPSARFESLHGGLGIMADDAMAAVYGNLLLRAMVYAAPAGWLI